MDYYNFDIIARCENSLENRIMTTQELMFYYQMVTIFEHYVI